MLKFSPPDHDHDTPATNTAAQRRPRRSFIAYAHRQLRAWGFDRATTETAAAAIATRSRNCRHNMSPNKTGSEDGLDKATLGVDLMNAQEKAKAVAARLSVSPGAIRTEVDAVKSRPANSTNGIRSSPPMLAPSDAMDLDTEPSNGVTTNADATTKSDSEAETIVLPGKNGHSPSKIRKSIKHEDRSEDEDIIDAPSIQSPSDGGKSLAQGTLPQVAEKATDSTTAGAMVSTSSLGKRKRPKHGTINIKDDPALVGNSSGLSSVPTSPVATTRSSLSKPAASDSEFSKSPSPRYRSAARDQAKSVDRVVQRRKQYTSASGEEDEGERPRFSRQRSSGIDHKSSRDNRSSSKFGTDTRPRKRTRSISPHSRGHRRSNSTQLPSKSSHGLGHKKKRVPAPLQSTEYQSDESSSGSSHPRSSRVRSVAAPMTGESTMSPAKIGPHKKHVNSSGQTLLARACLSGKLDVTKQRYDERPQDLNEADHALNTPLHVASINGFADIVKFLLDKNCIVDCVNDQRDTPLHDAIENGHVEVVKLLFDAGANPNKPNRHGDEPLDLVTEKEESGAYSENEATEIRTAIIAAKQNNRDVQRLSEDDHIHEHLDSRPSHPKDSARHSPQAPIHDSHVMSSTSRRGGTARSIKTSDHLLYQRLDATELRKAAKEGDASAAARVLEVNTNLKDSNSLLLAARGGHFDVINILFAMGGFDPDPQPIQGAPPEHNTPILATIGRDDHLKVIELFLGQDNFDPTRRIRGDTYYEIAKKRAGPKWQEEEKLLKDAYEKYESSHKGSRSPILRRDGRDSDAKRLRRDEQQASRSHKRTTSSPKAKDYDTSKTQHRNSSSINQSKESHPQIKRGPGRPRKEESAQVTAVSDPETTPLGPPKQKSQVNRSESEVQAASENETTTKPRRKLVSGKELRGERELEKQRRTSVASNTSSASTKDRRGLGESKGDNKVDGRLSPSVSRVPKKSTSSLNDHDSPSEKHASDKDRARSIKRDDSKDRLSAIRSESPVKRHRKSATPPRSGMQEVTPGYGAGGGPLKRRKLEAEAGTGPRPDATPTSSPDLRVSAAKIPSVDDDNGETSGLESKIKSPHSDVHVDDVIRSSKTDEPNSRGRLEKPADHGPASSHDSHVKKPKSDGEARSEHDDQEHAKDKKRKEEEEHVKEKKRKEEEEHMKEKKRKEEEEHMKEEKRKEDEVAREAERREAELQAAQQKALEEKQELERIEKAKQVRLAREEAAREEEARRQQEEAERKERQRIKDAEAHARAVEEQRVLYLEQERLKREELERRRALVVEQQRIERARIEEEKRLERLSKLPLLLRWFDLFDNPKTPDVASLFRWIDGYRYDTIRPEATGQANGREQWMLNTDAAILLGEKDLHLSRYTAWERIPLTLAAKRAVWRFHNGKFTLREPNLAGIRSQVPQNEGRVREMIEKNKALFFQLDLFFVKVSEFMFIVPNFPHLRGIEIIVNYRELDVTFQMPPPCPKWKQDPDTDQSQPFAPQPKVHINGQLLKQQDVPVTRILREAPSDEKRIPRRELVPAHPTDPDYEEICRKQGLTHLLPGYHASPSSAPSPSPSLPQPNGTDQVLEQTNGITPPSSDKTKSINGGSPHRGSISEADPVHTLPNGVAEVTSPPGSIPQISNQHD
ncbi:Ankyrin repeat-containing protein [Venustampulla echinocandica]|uniref:Ankyrin repeat-containing protein n=1 Tax=Venustampulla echinocandica TaxID=2656787 RepID=A0A370TY03_9HELO|nr:Ankyrin repeat-containing protein [Venustampulla echinocandica]RDL40405.1 Ankyrin repeat-containing protein [Venustampulla echinocandica]